MTGRPSPLPRRFASGFRRLAATLLAALLALIGLSQPMSAQARPARPAAARTAPVRPALWKVSDKDTTIWLFGTIHALPKGLEWYKGPVAAAFEQSDALVTEIIEKSPEEMRPIVLAKAMLPEGQTLRGMLAPADRAAFEKALAGNALPVAAFDRYQPWYAAVALATLPLLSSGYDPANGVDAQLSDRALAAKRGREALETPEFQLGLFGSLPLDTQKKYLREVVDNLPKLKGELNRIIAAWKAGDAARLARLMNEDEDDPVLEQRLLIDRNRDWAQWIKARMDKPGRVFIAVGAGHLAGAGSVQDQLARLGLRATRVQ
ncbi:MAG: TraB/GumN family protein [Sphingomonadales bacterium]|nr:TraB/GumN family protein [Sphingomonadales bacterium]